MFQEEYNVFQTAEIENPNGIPDREKVKYNGQVWQESKNQGGMKILKSGEVDLGQRIQSLANQPS